MLCVKWSWIQNLVCTTLLLCSFSKEAETNMNIRSEVSGVRMPGLESCLGEPFCWNTQMVLRCQAVNPCHFLAREVDHMKDGRSGGNKAETSFLYNYQRTLKVALQPSWSSFRVIYTVAILYHESDYSAAFQAEIIVYLDHLQLLFPAPSCGQLQGTLWKPEWTPADSPTYICLEWKNGIR